MCASTVVLNICRLIYFLFNFGKDYLTRAKLGNWNLIGHGAFSNCCTVFHFLSSCEVGIGKGRTQNWELV